MMNKENLEENKCEHCLKTFKSKSSLKTHIETNKKCIKERKERRQGSNENIDNIENIQDKCVYKCICNYETFNKHDFSKHKLKCNIDMLFDTLMKNKEKEIDDLKKNFREKEIELQTIIREKEIELKQKDHQIDSLTSLLEKSMMTPSIQNNNNNSTNTLKGNQFIQNILSDKYDEYTSHERIETIARQSIEKYFWEGQAGISRFCVDHIIATDGGKKIICCTDMSRKKFKYLKDDRLIEDVEARAFTEKISLPIKKVCREVYDSTIRKIEEEREEKTDAFELNLLDHKTNRAQKNFLDIINIDDNTQNTEYKNELSILLKI